MIDDYDHGVWFVDLAPIQDTGLVAQTVAASLGLREEPGQPIEETLAEFTKDRRLLVVLDNCEHVVASCAALVDGLLRMSPGLRILATSREALAIGGRSHLAGAAAGSAGPRADGEVPESHADLNQYDAVRLFVDRAAAVQPELHADERERAGGGGDLPPARWHPAGDRAGCGAGEGADASSRSQRGSDDRFRLLTGGSRTALPRQQTLRAADGLELRPARREPSGRCSRGSRCSRGGWTLEAAEAVCAGEGIEVENVLDKLSHLVDKSLVVVGDAESGEVRYGYLETVRQYAGDKLAVSGGDERVTNAHLEHFLCIAEVAELELQGSAQVRMLELLEMEHGNLRAALETAETTGRADQGQRLGAALWRFWMYHGHLSEGRSQLNRMLALSARQAGTPERSGALSGAGALGYFQGEYEAAQAYFEESLGIRREFGDLKGISEVLRQLGIVALGQGDLELARSRIEDSLAVTREIDDENGVAKSLMNLGIVFTNQGDYVIARALYEESLLIFRDLGDSVSISNALVQPWQRLGTIG